MKRLLLIPILSLLLWNCSKSDDMVNEFGESTPITISVDEESLTRGSVADTEATMETVGMYCTHYKTSDPTTPEQRMTDEKFSYDPATGWSGESGIVWGHESITDTYSFYAYSPCATDSNGITPDVDESGALKIDYTVPTTCADQVDLLVATPRKNIYPQMGGKVHLRFNHTLAKVEFSVKGDASLKIVDITLNDITSTSTLTFNESGAFSWNNEGAVNDFTVSEGSGLKSDVTTSDTPQNITSGDGYLFMIPQTLTAGSIIDVTISDGRTVKTIPYELTKDVVWASNKAYNLVFTCTPFGVELNVSVGDWQSVDHDDEYFYDRDDKTELDYFTLTDETRNVYFEEGAIDRSITIPFDTDIPELLISFLDVDTDLYSVTLDYANKIIIINDQNNGNPFVADFIIRAAYKYIKISVCYKNDTAGYELVDWISEESDDVIEGSYFNLDNDFTSRKVYFTAGTIDRSISIPFETDIPESLISFSGVDTDLYSVTLDYANKNIVITEQNSGTPFEADFTITAVNISMKISLCYWVDAVSYELVDDWGSEESYEVIEGFYFRLDNNFVLGIDEETNAYVVESTTGDALRATEILFTTDYSANADFNVTLQDGDNGDVEVTINEPAPGFTQRTGTITYTEKTLNSAHTQKLTISVGNITLKINLEYK